MFNHRLYLYVNKHLKIALLHIFYIIKSNKLFWKTQISTYRHFSIYAVKAGTHTQKCRSKNSVNRGYLVRSGGKQDRIINRVKSKIVEIKTTEIKECLFSCFCTIPGIDRLEQIHFSLALDKGFLNLDDNICDLLPTHLYVVLGLDQQKQTMSTIP